MAQFLAVQVRLGNINMEDIPEKYRMEVEKILNVHLDNNVQQGKIN